MRSRKALINDCEPLSVRTQCRLLEVSRAGYYYQPASETPLNQELLNVIDKIFTEHPFYGTRKLTELLKRKGYKVNRKRVQRLMRLLGLEALYPKGKGLSQANPNHKKYPYLLRKLEITRPNYVWCTDITYLPMKKGFMYLVAVMDWYSRYVLSWELSNSLSVHFCLEALERALENGKPEIFNTDQGSQFTSSEFVGRLEANGIRVSMDGRGRFLDNVFIERLWRSVKYEEVYLKNYDEVSEAFAGLDRYFTFYNGKRLHQSLGYRTPEEVHFENHP